MTAVGLKVDPFTRVYDALVALIADHDGVKHLLKTGNLIDYSGGRADPTKGSIQSGDLPEIEVRPAGGDIALWKDSDSSEIVRRFIIALTTGDLRVDKSLLPLEWEIVRALSRTVENLGLSFVTKLTIEGFDEERRGTEEHRGTKGWVALFSVVVEMNFSRQDDLLAAEPDFGA